MAASWCLALSVLLVMVTGGAGHCPQACPPNLQHRPVCGSNGRTYSSDCELQKAACRLPLLGNFLKKSHNGPCTGSSTGPGIQVSVGGVSVGVGGGNDQVGGRCWKRCYNQPYSPVCGSNGHTYDNDCLLQVARCRDIYLTVAYDGACRGGGNCGRHYCSQDYRPVCGSDRRTYDNDCEFQRAACWDRYLSVSYYGSCRGGNGWGPGGCYYNCGDNRYEPVCGSDGRTYSTYCHLQEAQCRDRSLTLRYRGPCGYVRTEAWQHLSQVNVPDKSLPEDLEQLLTTTAEGGQRAETTAGFGDESVRAEEEEGVEKESVRAEEVEGQEEESVRAEEVEGQEEESVRAEEEEKQEEESVRAEEVEGQEEESVRGEEVEGQEEESVRAEEVEGEDEEELDHEQPHYRIEFVLRSEEENSDEEK